MKDVDRKAERDALARQVETPLAPHEPETDGFVDLRQRCECGVNVGRVRLVGNQLTVRCADCDRFHFNAPRALLGLPNAAPKAVKLASRYAGRCRLCQEEHEIGHWVYWTKGVKGVECAKCHEAGGGE